MGEGIGPVCGGGGGPSVAGRAALAVGLMIGFYVLAIAIAGALLFLCYAMVVWGHRVPAKLLLIMVVSAGAILWSIIPRIDRFTPPGPELKREKHPRLFAEIESVARATGQSMPVEVFLVPDVNAWVAQRGGVMGVGSKRVMGVGLALMRVLTVSEFRAVLAHEFGHYYGGDTKLGPWVYKTRSAIGRTVMTLGGGALQKPFLWYGNMFLRVTHAVSRRQEFTADRLAATTAGRDSLASGLRKTHGAGMAFEPFWRTEMVPVLSGGFRVPLAEGFGRFMASAPIAEAMDKAIDNAMREGKVNPYDTHPPLNQRIAAVSDLPAGGLTTDGRSAIVLLENVGEMEQWLLVRIAGLEAVKKLADTQWEEIGERVWVPLWRKAVKENGRVLEGLTPENLMERVVPSTRNGAVLQNEEVQRKVNMAGAALVLAAVDAGAVLECQLGEAVSVERMGMKIEPFKVMEQLSKGELTAAEWEVQCTVLGITGADLAGTWKAPDGVSSGEGSA